MAARGRDGPVENGHTCRVEGSEGRCWLKHAGADAVVTREIAWSLLRECLPCELLQDSISRAGGRRTADQLIGRTLSVMLDELHNYDEQLQLTSSSLRRRVAELTLLNQISDALSRSTNLGQTIQLFLIGVTAGGAGGLNRALLFLKEGDELVGQAGLGHLSRDEGQKTWIAMAESGSELQQLIDGVFAGTFRADADLNNMVSTLRLRRDGDSPVAAALNERMARHHRPGSDMEDPRLTELYRETPFVAVPLMMEHDEVGVLVADNFVSGTPILEETVSLLQTLSNQAASDVVNHRLHADLQRQLQETEHLYELLRENQNYLLQHERLVDMGKLATTVAHEIKTPLVAIGGFARRAERHLQSGEQPSERDLSMIIKEVSRLERITSEILDYSKEVRLNFERVDLRETLDDSLEVVESRLDTLGIEVNRHYPDDSCLVKADPRRLKQVVLNLIENAIDALSATADRPGGGTITLVVSRGTDGVKLEVSDTGPGIPEDLFDRVFTPFFTTKPDGSGLGLPVTRRIVTDHGGRISLSRNERGQTRFLIELPGWRESAVRERLHVTNTGG